MTTHTDISRTPKVHLVSCGGWWLPKVAGPLHQRGSLAGLWISDNDRTTLPRELVHRCWRFQAAMQPFFRLAPQIVIEKAFYALFPLWRSWIRTRQLESANVVQAIMGYATEPFDAAEKTGALKVVDCPNSHPVSYYGYWQRECDLWCPGEKVPIPQWMFARMNRELARADLILCPSTFVRDTMIANGLPEAKCFVNPFGVNTSVFKPRIRVPDKPRFVAVGTVCVRKGHQYLFRAFEKVKRRCPDAELICVGDIKTDFRLEQPRWTGTFTHIPSLEHHELAKLLATCTAFVFPSCEEGFARVIPEAMAAGLPIIASHESGATTLVDDGVEGLIICAQDTDHIAEAMIKIALDGELNNRMGEAAYRKGAISNTWQDYGDRLLDEYKSRLALR